MCIRDREDGILTDAQGRRVDFKNAVIIMTSNVGARKITESKKLGFGDQDASVRSPESIREEVMGELRRTFRPEFLNRVDDIIVFHQLGEDDIRAIAERMLANLTKRVKAMDIDLTFTPEAVTAISKAGFDPVYGARPLRRAIQSKIEDPFSEELLEGRFKAGEQAVCDWKEDKFQFAKQASA